MYSSYVAPTYMYNVLQVQVHVYCISDVVIAGLGIIGLIQLGLMKRYGRLT